MTKKFLLMNCNGKAMVEEFGLGCAHLYSYGTLVATIVLPEVWRAEGQPQSNTTLRHMREFFKLYGLPCTTKAEIMALPTIEED